MPEEIKILCVDDEPNVLKSLRRLFLDEDDYEVLTAESGAEGLAVLEAENVRLVVSDYRMPGMNGVEFLSKVYERWPDTIRIVLSGYADTVAVVEAINLGQIYKFIPKPWNDEELKSTIAIALSHQELKIQNKRLSEELQHKNQELEKINEQLELLVEKRTRSLEVRNKTLQIAQAVLDVVTMAVYGIDADGMIVQCNERGSELFGFNEVGLIGKHCKDVFPEQLYNLITLSRGKDNLVRTLTLNNRGYYIVLKSLPDSLSDGTIMELIPQHLDKNTL